MKLLNPTNICFIANYSFTYLFSHLVEALKEEDISIFWIVNNKKLYDFLVDKYSEEQILYISRAHFQKTEKPIADFKLNELIYGDRVLNFEPQNGLNFLTNIQRPIYDFLKQNEIRMVMGELTWAHEVLIHRMCRQRPELDCTFLNPHVVRIPDNRFAFFTDERQSKIFEIQQTKVYEQPIRAKKPAYLQINDQSIKKSSSLLGRIDRASRFFTSKNIEKQDPTLIVNQQWRFETCASEELNRIRYQSIERTPFDVKEMGNYVFLGLHKQPESTVDIFGRYYEDQLQNIKNLWRALPQGWKLLVKEHTNAIGDRSPAFYKTIQALPGVVLIDETTNSYDIIQNAQLVATITGTVAYEAALMGVPSVTFAPVFFNKINSCNQITLEDLSKYRLDQIAFGLKRKPDNLIAFTNYLMNNSFEGKFYDPQTTESALESNNISSISQALIIAVKKLVGVSSDIKLTAVENN